MISVILLEKISKLGNIGEEVRVKAGFARNYLLPKKKAIRASKENKKVFEQKREELVSSKNNSIIVDKLPLNIVYTAELNKIFPKNTFVHQQGSFLFIQESSLRSSLKS